MMYHNKYLWGLDYYKPCLLVYLGYSEQEVSSCSRFVHNMDSAVKFLMDTSIDQTKKHMGHYKKEFQKIGQAFYAFGNAMQVDSSGESL